jgi:hypothetical protein
VDDRRARDTVEKHPRGRGGEQSGNPILETRGKPFLCKRSRIYSQLTESKALRISRLKINVGILALLNLVARFFTYRKLL